MGRPVLTGCVVRSDLCALCGQLDPDVCGKASHGASSVNAAEGRVPVDLWVVRPTIHHLSRDGRARN